MGGLFSLNFVIGLFPGTILGLLSWALIVVIVIAMYNMSVRFREIECDGYITYGKAFSLVLLTFFFGAIISSLVKYIYFQYINTEYLRELLGQSLQLMEQMNFPVTDEMYKATESMLSPIGFSITYLWINVFWGIIVGLILAAAVKKDKSIFH